MTTSGSIQFQAGGLTDRGQGRERNEDAYLVDDGRGLFLVADGMGGRRGGGVASQAIVKHLPELLDNRLRHGPARRTVALRDTVLDLNAIIRKAGEQGSGLRGMGTTLACLFIHGRTAYVANMGDSRIYRWRNGLTRLTQDHSLTALLLREGEISARSAAIHPARGQLTRYVGMEQDIYPDVGTERIRAGDRFLLCTDGLWNVLPDSTIARMLDGDYDPASFCSRLVEAAKAAGSDDNITCVVVACGKTKSRSRIRRPSVYSATEGM